MFLKFMSKYIIIQKMNLRQQMLAYFQQPEINEKIIEYVSNHNLNIEQLDQLTLINMIQQLQLLKQIQKKVQGQQSHHQPIHKLSHQLTLTINKGRKFKQLSQLQKPASFYFTLSAFQQKVKSSVYPVAQNFSISQKLSLKMKGSMLKSDNNQNLQLIIVCILNNKKKILYSIKLIQWRFVLVYGSINVDIQLAPYFHDGLKTLPSAGILSISLRINPVAKNNFLSQLSLNRQIQLQQRLKQSSNNKFHAYANNFWSQIKNIHRSFQSRRISIYAQTQDKIYYALPKMIKPIYGIRGIDSPHHALRFTSLIPFTEPQLNKQPFYRRFSSLLSGNQGSIQDHCHLLCSMLLGMGLKAYVCIGTISKGQHSWVMTQNNNSITFWQCTKGIKVDFFSPKSLTFYKTINVVYNNNEYYANIQLDCSISGTKYNFKDNILWKSMDQNILKQLNQFNKSLSLSYPTINTYLTEQNIQNQLSQLIDSYRKKMKLSFNYDQKLSTLLSTALSNYQIQRVTGNTFCQEEFQYAIKSYIPNKHTFKAFPMQFTTLDPTEIFQQLQQQPKAKQILLIKGQSINFAVRSKLVIFPENIFALWISLAVRFYRIE